MHQQLPWSWPLVQSPWAVWKVGWTQPAYQTVSESILAGMGWPAQRIWNSKAKVWFSILAFFPLSAKGHRWRRACTDQGFADERTEAPPVVPEDQDCIFEPSPNWESRGPAVHLGDCGPAVYNWFQRCTTALDFILSAFSPFPALFR